LTDFSDLEISLQRRDGESYSVEMRLSQPNSDADIRLGQGEALSASFDLTTLQGLIGDPAEYGKNLADSLFADAGIASGFAQARTGAESLHAPLRVRLLIGPGAPELNTLYWEALYDTQNKAPLFTGENVLFSRYLSSSDWRPVKLRPKGTLKALAAVANPSDLAAYKLAPVDVAGELERAKEALGNVPVVSLPGGDGEKCTLNTIIDRLRDGYDILYLAAHGALVKGEPFIWLEGEDGKLARAAATDFVARIRELQNQPRLIVLASCQSAGDGNGSALQAFGPRLAEAGIPAVIAMQGNISMESVKKFMPVFFDELQKDGQIDRALAVARGTVRDRFDFWIPVLFMRLKSGKIWYVPGFGEEGGDFQKWPAVLGSIQGGQCTPILGNGANEPLMGSWRDMALAIAEKYNYPLAPFYRDALPQVAQYLLVNQDLNTLYNEFEGALRAVIQARYAADLPNDLKGPQSDVEALVSAGGAALRKKDPTEPHKVLAQLPLPLYITTNFNNMLADALKEAGRDPQVAICPWSDRFTSESIYDTQPDFRPTPDKPLVYHLLGKLDVPDSMVLTEDDYFAFLIGVTSNKDLIPPAVRRAIADTALLFVGFELDDWAFHVLFRTIMGQQGGARRSRYSHIGVQVSPDENRTVDPRRARDYLDRYFQESSISLFWGSAQDFLRELHAQLKLPA